MVPSIEYEKVLIESLHNYLSALEELGVEQPIFVFLTLLGVKGYRMAVNQSIAHEFSAYEIDRDVLLLPEIMIERYDEDERSALRPCFDAIWSACGYPRSLNYNEDGKWIGR